MNAVASRDALDYESGRSAAGSAGQVTNANSRGAKQHQLQIGQLVTPAAWTPSPQLVLQLFKLDQWHNAPSSQS